METVMEFIFLGSKITAYGDCSQEIKRNLLLGIKATLSLPTAAARPWEGPAGPSPRPQGVIRFIT